MKPKNSITVKISVIDLIMKARKLSHERLVEKCKISIGTVNKTVKLLRSSKPSTKFTKFQQKNVALIANAVGATPELLVGKMLINIKCEGDTQ